jgi:hypothetical protein
MCEIFISHAEEINLAAKYGGGHFLREPSISPAYLMEVHYE